MTVVITFSKYKCFFINDIDLLGELACRKMEKMPVVLVVYLMSTL